MQRISKLQLKGDSIAEGGILNNQIVARIAVRYITGWNTKNELPYFSVYDKDDRLIADINSAHVTGVFYSYEEKK